MNRIPRHRWIASLLVLAVIVAGGFAYRYYWRPPMEEFDRVAAAELFDRPEVIKQVTATCPPERRPELLRRVAGLEEGEHMALAVLVATMDADPANADPVLEAYRKQFPKEPLLPMWAFAVRIKQERFDEATRMYREEAARVAANESDRQYLQYQFLQRMTDAGRPVEAYAEADPRDLEYAFRILAGRLDEACDRGDPAAIEKLRTLVAAHTKRAEPTPWTTHYSGRADEAEQKYEEAQRQYAEVMRQLKAAGHVPRHQLFRGTAATDWGRVQHRRIYCLWRLGRWEQAYDECEPAEDTFRWLSQVFEPPERTDDLQRLVARHRGKFPEDPTLPYWQATVHWNRSEYAKAVPLFDEHLRVGKLPLLFEQQAINRKFRSLIRLERLDEARAVLNPPERPRWPDELHWRMILAAKTGDEATLDRILSGFVAVRSDYPAGAYADEDLGPLLMADSLTGLRKKYPPPTAGKP